MYWPVPSGHKHLLLTVPLSRAEHRLSWPWGSTHGGVLSLTLPSGPLPYRTPTPLLKTRLRICKPESVTIGGALGEQDERLCSRLALSVEPIRLHLIRKEVAMEGGAATIAYLSSLRLCL